MLIRTIKGILIGLGLVIPGLSASTFAVVVGLYDDIISNVNNLRRQFKKSCLFLFPVAIGVAIGILASTQLIFYVIENFPVQSYALFIGLVLGSLPMLVKKLGGRGREYKFYPLSVLGFAVIMAMGFFAPDTGDTAIAIYSIEGAGDAASIFAAGVISCFLMAVPGMSGSVMLMLLGHFGTVYGAVSNFVDVGIMAVRGQPGAVEAGLDSVAIIGVFGVGAVIGVVLAAKLIGMLLERHEVPVYFAVMGLIAGAVVILFNMGIGSAMAAGFGRGFGAGAAYVLWLLVFVIIGAAAARFIGEK